jgi:hypothetical protein
MDHQVAEGDNAQVVPLQELQDSHHAEPEEPEPEAQQDNITQIPARRPPRQAPPPREPSQRIRKAPDRLTLLAEAAGQDVKHQHPSSERVAYLSVAKALKEEPIKAKEAIIKEVSSLVAKHTWTPVHLESISEDQRKGIIHCLMFVTQKYLPSTDENNMRVPDKMKARLCANGSRQDRDAYEKGEISSPTASIGSMFAIGQIAALEGRVVVTGDVETAYLNAKMPKGDPKKLVFMAIPAKLAEIVCEVDPRHIPYRRRDGSVVVELDRALYGCIQSANLWYQELKDTLEANGFKANAKDACIFNKTTKGTQITLAIYVDDIMITCKDAALIRGVENFLREKYGGFKTCEEQVLPYLGLMWDFRVPGEVSVSQPGIISDLVKSREATLAQRDGKLPLGVKTPTGEGMFERSILAPLLSDRDKAIYHTDVATLLFIACRTRVDLVLGVSELCRHTRAPTQQDDAKLDRVIAFMKQTAGMPLRLKAKAPLQVVTSIDAAFANRTEMKSTSGACTTLGEGMFIAFSRMQKLNSKSSTEAEIIALSDGSNTPLWLADWLRYQGYPHLPILIEQDNISCMTLMENGHAKAETTRFIEVRFFWIYDYIKRGLIKLVKVPTEEMASDYFTKPVQGAIFQRLHKRIMGYK